MTASRVGGCPSFGLLMAMPLALMAAADNALEMAYEAVAAVEDEEAEDGEAAVTARVEEAAVTTKAGVFG